jgi:Zn-dependent peptidase ImmA (M78 family)
MENLSLRQLKERYNCTALNEVADTYPVPVGTICSILGIEASYYQMNDDESGNIFLENGKYFIQVNTSHAPTRKRFTVAHELGHYYHHKDFLDKEGKILERNNYLLDQKEVEANAFAAELLMPKTYFVKKYNELRQIKKLAEYFFVSEIAINVRLINLGLAIE